MKERSLLQYGNAGQIRSTANEQRWTNSQVKTLINTQVLCRVFHDIQYCCSWNRALSTTMSQLRERDGYTDPELKEFTTTYKNLTSSDIVAETLKIMSQKAEASTQQKIRESPFCSIITDETQDVTRLSQHAILIRVVNPTTFDT